MLFSGINAVSARSLLTIGITAPLGAIALCTSPSLAQTSIPGASIICAYNANSGIPNPLGMRSFITVAQVEDDTVFVYEQLPSPVLNENNRDIETDISNRRTLTIYSKPIEEARQILANSPDSYSALLGVQGEAPEAGFSFASINNTLACQNVADETTNGEMTSGEMTNNETTNAPLPTPTAPTPEATAPAKPQATLADLPNGNYRVASATYPLRVVSDEELVKNGGVLFSFRKFGEEVTGRFNYIDSDLGACIAGTIEGNTVTGKAYTDDNGFSPEESTAIFLGPGGFLLLGENDGGPVRTGARSYDSARLDLEGFSRINAGTMLPPESCP